jgi:Kyakuja-Dileera-Zisupton transposase
VLFYIHVFSSHFYVVSADVIVCIDACFTHKRRNPAKGGAKGPENLHPETVFVSEKKVAEMKAFVETTRPVKSKSKEKTKEGSDGHGVEDSYEPGMKVPVSALEGCLASFVAADERRTKASTQFFADTGLMAMLCCHDHVLWIVNMTTAGEQQYYALALIKELFLNLPLSMTVGILYDIGCQLERSCKIWGFLEEFMARIIFALAVFHAYGHQWPCQLIYHPRKCEGFGLSDGEGCERFWSSIKLLIPSMRVAGVSHHMSSL